MAEDPSGNGVARPVRLVVLGDSTAFTGSLGPLLPDDPTLYPNVVARELERGLGRPVAVSTLAQPGTHTRDAWRMVTKDRHVQFEVMMGADAVVVGVSSFDHAPMGVPPALEALVPFLRPAALRRRARRTLRAAYPRLVAATRGRFPRTADAEFERLYDALLLQARSLARGAAGVVLGPTEHRSPYYGFLNPHRARRERRQFAIAARHGFPAVACWPLVEPHAGRLNVDGIHWPPEAHEAVGRALAAPLLAQLRDGAPRPPFPDLPGLSGAPGAVEPAVP